MGGTQSSEFSSIVEGALDTTRRMLYYVLSLEITSALGDGPLGNLLKGEGLSRSVRKRPRAPHPNRGAMLQSHRDRAELLETFTLHPARSLDCNIFRVVGWKEDVLKYIHNKRTILYSFKMHQCLRSVRLRKSIAIARFLKIHQQLIIKYLLEAQETQLRQITEIYS
ncbi:hypothetical protein Fmac_028240 [Flemingia macrophylla]|uniref:Uncharacterized protein n=1 Tax=Flemingia macrophylla TaxID=520843 RepID=A0ABD1L6Y5_9FABA